MLRKGNTGGASGFTLVELLVVVVIIVALAAIAVPIFIGQKAKADEAAVKSDLTAAGKMLVTAASTNGTVTIDSDDRQFHYANPDGSETSLVATKGTFSLYNILPGDKVGSGSCIQLAYEQFTFSYTVPTGLADGACAP
jgi:type IV pilus assembly protein PilA